MSNAAIARYQMVQISTASPGEILVALFDGLFRFLHAARINLNGGALKRGPAGEAISKAYAIIAEFLATLDHERCPELCKNLVSVYDFCLRRLTEANRFNRVEAIEDVIRVMTPVREGFTQAVKKLAQDNASNKETG